MFTGLVTGIGEVVGVDPVGARHPPRRPQHAPSRVHAASHPPPPPPPPPARLTIQAPSGFLAASDRPAAAIGASIACSGCCLTAIAIDGDRFTVDVSAESLSLTTIGHWRRATRINLERSLRLGDELGGHLVSGHVDGLGALRHARPDQGSLRLAFTAPPDLAPLIARKGSIAVDGVSLTANAVSADGFDVNIIPHTASHTTLGLLAAGDPVHLEVDMLARYVARLVETGSRPAALTGPAAVNSP